MRQDTLNKATSVSTKSVQGYHSGGTTSENYAFAGFNIRKYYTSDRYILLDEHFQRADRQSLKGYGLEIEIECFSINNSNVLCEAFDKLIADRFPADYFKYQHDGSLGGASNLEAITQPATKEFIRNHYPEYKVMFDSYFPALEISASRTGHCGMHVNLSLGLFGTTKEKQDEAIRKLYYIINKHFDFFCVAFNRDRNRTGYCDRMPHDMDYVKSMNLSTMSGSHYNCLNYGHYNAGRVEIRLVGGQSKFACFRNTMETVFHIVDAVKRISWKDCDSLPAIFKGCNFHVLDRIKTNCLDAGVISRADVEAIRANADLTERYI